MANRRFHFSWIALIVALAVAASGAQLALWQLARAKQKETLLENIESRAKQPPFLLGTLNTLLSMADPDHYPVQLRGHFDNQHHLLLDNRLLNGVAGYYLLTPFITNTATSTATNTQQWILINRGWLPRGPQRDQLPNIPPITGEATVTGNSYRYSSKTFTLANDNLADVQWPLRVQKIEMQAIGQLLGVELAPFEIRVTPDAKLEQSAQLPRPWQNASKAIMGPQRHHAYALQWFALAAMALVVYIAASFRKTEAL